MSWQPTMISHSLWQALYSPQDLKVSLMCFALQMWMWSQRELKFKVNTYLSVNTQISVFFTYTLSRPPGSLSFQYTFRCLLCVSLPAYIDANYLNVFFSWCGISEYISGCHFKFLGFTFDFRIGCLMKWWCTQICIHFLGYISKCHLINQYTFTYVLCPPLCELQCKLFGNLFIHGVF